MWTLLHESHQGVEKSKACIGLAWQETLRIHCGKRVEWRRNNRKEPLIPHEVPARPWQKLRADLFELRGQNYLCVVDYYSKFPEISLRQPPLVHLKSIFARHGVPDELMADNMPFASHELQIFASSRGFKITTSSLRYPQSSGMSERTIGTMKQLLRKAEDPFVALLEYRNTHVTGIGLSPSQMLNSQWLNCLTAAELLKPNVALYACKKLLDAQQRQKYYYDCQAKSLKGLEVEEWILDSWHGNINMAYP